MADAKVVVLGAGSFVLGSSVLDGAIVEHRLRGLEIALMDQDRQQAELVAAAARHLARDAGVECRINVHAQHETAMDGADFVLCADIGRESEHLKSDWAVLKRCLPGGAVSPSRGVGGLCYSLRQIAYVQEIVGAMKRFCPKAWFLNATDPLARTSQAARDDGVRTVGLCSTSQVGFMTAWRILEGETLAWPFDRARNRLEMTMAGVNRFSWIIRIADADTGQDLYPTVRQKATQQPDRCSPLALALLQETGFLPACGDAAIQDFVDTRHSTPNAAVSTQDNAAEQQRWLNTLRDAVEGRTPWAALQWAQSWIRPMDLVASMAFGKPACFHALNLPNAGQMPALPATVFVETPALAANHGPVAERVELPEPLLPLCRTAAMVTDLIVRGARWRKRSLLDEAIELDPTIPDKAVAAAALTECLAADRGPLSGLH